MLKIKIQTLRTETLAPWKLLRRHSLKGKPAFSWLQESLVDLLILEPSTLASSVGRLFGERQWQKQNAIEVSIVDFFRVKRFLQVLHKDLGYGVKWLYAPIPLNQSVYSLNQLKHLRGQHIRNLTLLIVFFAFFMSIFSIRCMPHYWSFWMPNGDDSIGGNAHLWFFSSGTLGNCQL